MVIIQISKKDRAKAWALLVRHSAGTALPGGTFIVSEEAASALRRAKIRFAEVSRDPAEPAVEAQVSRERV